MSRRASHPEPVACSIGDNSATRREFLTRMRGAAAATLTSAAVTPGSSADADQGPPGSVDGGSVERVLDSYENRVRAARAETRVPVPRQITNGDERRYLSFIGNFSKGLPHNNLGEVDPAVYRSLLDAVRQGTAAAFENLTLGGNTKLVNPLAGLAFDLEGTDSHQLVIPPFPQLASQALADQAVELYWMALCRDVNFTDYESTTLTMNAAKELSKFPLFKGVKPRTLFRGFTAEHKIGPYVSQFLLKKFSYGPYTMSRLMNVAVPDIDYLTSEAQWLASQNGQGPFGANQVDGTLRCLRNGRDLASYVHTDPNAGLFMSFYNAGIFLFEQNALLQGSSSLLNPGNPYLHYKTQDPFGTFGVPFFLGLVGEAAVRAFKAAWYAKWFVHRALRPDQYGGLVHWAKTGKAAYPIPTNALDSEAVTGVFTKNGTYFLPQAYPEAGPQHPSYPSGHATMAGACATILKAAFNGGVQFNTLPDGKIVAARSDGGDVMDYTDPHKDQITINGELNKLASNIAQGRDFAGIHWRSDAEEGMRLGEVVAISILRDQSDNYVGEDFEGFRITKFDGATITV
jgi:membrane-associated phospholipid phosphatase